MTILNTRNSDQLRNNKKGGAGKRARLLMMAIAPALAFVPAAFAGQGTASYLDFDSTNPGFGTPTGTISETALIWSTSNAGTLATTARPSGTQLTIGNLPTDFAGQTFTIDLNGGGNLQGILINSTSVNVTLTGTSNTHNNSGPNTWTVAAGSTLNEADTRQASGSLKGLNWNSVAVTFAGGGTINFVTPLGANSTGVNTQNMSGGTVNLQQQSTGTNSYTGGYILTSGTLNFATAASFNTFNGFTSTNSSLFTLNGGTFDNTSGADQVLSVGTGGYALSSTTTTFKGTNAIDFGTSGMALTGNGTLSITANKLTVGGVISGSNFGFTKAGAGSLVLTGASTYTGATSVNGGTLVLQSSSVNDNIAGSTKVTVGSAGTLDVTGVTTAGGFTVASGQTLVNNGTINGAVSVGSGATLSGTAGVFNGALSVTSTGTYTIHVSGATADSVTVAGAANFDGDANLNVLQLAAPSAASYTVLSATSITGLTAGVIKTIGRTTYSVDGAALLANQVQIDVGGGAANLRWDNTGGTGDGITWENAQTQQNFNNGGNPDYFYDGDLVTFNDNNGGKYNVTISGTVSPGSVTITNNNANYTFSGSGTISGVTSVTVNGTQTVFMAANNTYSGGTTIASGATLDLGNGTGSGSLGTGTITANGTLVLHRSDAPTISNVIGGAGSLLVNGSVTLSGANTFSGGITINSGTLKAGSTGALGATTGGAMTIAGGAALDLNNFLVNSGRQITISGAGPDGNGAIVNNSATNQTTAGNYIAKVSLAADATIGGVARWDFRNNTPVLDLNGHTLTKKGTNQVSVVAGTIQSTGGAGVIDVMQGILSLETTTTADTSVSSGGITYESGTIAAFFQNTGTINWPMTMVGGNTIGNGGSGAATVASPMTLQGNVTFEPLNNGAPSTTNANPLTWTGAITESGGARNVTKLGLGTTTLANGANVWTGVTEIDGGILAGTVLADGGLASSFGTNSSDAANILIGGANGTLFGELGYAGSSATSSNRKFTLTGVFGGVDASGTVAGATLTMSDTGPLTFSTSGTHTFVLSGTNTGNNTYSGGVQDNGGATTLQKSGAGTWVVTAANTYSGPTNIQQGTLVLGGAGALPANSTVVIGNTTGNTSGTLDLNGNSQTLVSLTTSGTGAANTVINNGTTNATLTLSPTGADAFGGLIKDGATNSISVAVTSGTVTLSGASTYTGTTTVSPGAILSLTNSNGAGAIPGGTVTIASGATLQISNGTANNLNFGLKEFDVAGAGVDGNGVIINTGTNNQQNAFEKVVLTGDATFGGAQRFDIRAAQVNNANVASLNLNGHTLTKSGTLAISLVAVDVSDGNITVNQGTLALEGTTSVPDFGTGTSLTYNSGTTLQVFESVANTLNIKRPININGTVTVGNNSNIAGNIDSNMSLNGNITVTALNANGTGVLALNGVISETGGPHAITKTNNGTGVSTLVLGGNNTFTGGVLINGGVVQLANAGALNATTPNAVTFGPGAVAATKLQLNGNSVTVASVSTDAGTPGSPMVENANAAAATLTVNNASADTFAGVLQDGAGGGALSVAKSNAGVLLLTGANTYSGGTGISGGTLVAGNVQALGTGKVAVHNGGALQLQSGLAKAVIVPGLTFDGNGSADLTNDKLIVQDSVTHAASVATLQAAAHSSLTSSTMAANYGIAVIDNGALTTPFGTFGGQTVDVNSILVSPELLGDANADGNVDGTDLNAVLTNFGASTLAWTSGNFDGSSTVDLTDLAYVLNNFGMHNANASTIAGGAVAQAVPEPTSLAMVGLSAAALLKRRRKA